MMKYFFQKKIFFTCALIKNKKFGPVSYKKHFQNPKFLKLQTLLKNKTFNLIAGNAEYTDHAQFMPCPF